MKIKPILFSTPMVQAILQDRKTQTRRIVKDKMLQENVNKYNEEDFLLITMKNPISKGNILWVRETFELVPIQNASVKTIEDDVQYGVIYKADFLESFQKWSSSIFMPKTACRIFLEVTNVRVELLQDISEDDAIAEGVRYHSDENNENLLDAIFQDYVSEEMNLVSSYSSFRSLWLSINGEESWDKNPWVWVYDFKRVEKPENFITS